MNITSLVVKNMLDAYEKGDGSYGPRFMIDTLLHEIERLEERKFEVPPLRWQPQPGNPKCPSYAYVFDEVGYGIWKEDGKFKASRYQWSGPVRDTLEEAVADAEADYQKTMKRLLKIN